jgi:predicted nucleotidyltransferase
MNIDPGSEICGVNAVVLRDVIRGLRDPWPLTWLAADLHIGMAEAHGLVTSLVLEGLVERVGDDPAAPEYRNTIAGNALANASAAKPVHRKTAERAVAEFLARVQRVNADDHYLYRVERVRVFGSYLTQCERLSDVDLVVEMVPKIEDSGERLRLVKERVSEAELAGRSFASYLDELGWGEVEVWLFLKGRSRVLSLHLPDDAILELVDTDTLHIAQRCG